MSSDVPSAPELNINVPSDTESIESQAEHEESDAPKGAVEYETRFVAFIDILGFSDLVRRSAKNSELVRQISQALMLNSDSNTPDSLVRRHTFSDFVVLSAPATEEGLSSLVFEAWVLSKDWLSKGFLARGGVAVGELIHVTDSGTPIVFGPAFLEAYRIEQEIADFPRIVFAPQARMRLEEFTSNCKKTSGDSNTCDRFFGLAQKCSDGPYCIDLYAHLRVNGIQLRQGGDERGEAKQFRDALDERLSEGIDTPKHYRKIHWLCEQFNSAIQDTKYADLKIKFS